MRNITSFPVQVRDDIVKLIVPARIPAFAPRKKLVDPELDPRNIVIIGDSEAAISAIMTLRYSFTGEIYLLPTSHGGSLLNRDVLMRRFYPLRKEETNIIDPDIFNVAAVKIIRSSIHHINHDERIVYLEDQKKIGYDAIIFAGSALKINPLSKYTNVHQIEDLDTHQKTYNSVLKSKHTCIIGSDFEAFQLACSIRTRLDALELDEIKLTIFDQGISEVAGTLGPIVYSRILKDFHELGINVISGARILKMEGDYKLERIKFLINNSVDDFYHIAPDCYIVERQLGAVNHKIMKKISQYKPKIVPKVDANHVISIDKNFSALMNKNNMGFFACGQNADCLSYM